jgi:fatty acid desaturase
LITLILPSLSLTRADRSNSLLLRHSSRRRLILTAAMTAGSTMTQLEVLASRTATSAMAPVGKVSTLQPHYLPNGKLTCHVRIDDMWVDLTHWAATHPGGDTILHQMNGKDATDAFYSLHSPEAIARLKRLPSSSTIPAHIAPFEPAPATKATLAFREFRAQLQREGWWERNLVWEAFYTSSVYILSALGTWAAFTGHPIIATLLIGFAMQQAGWIAHDYIHARGAVPYWNAVIMQWCNGFSREWWSHKHNTHHVFTNHIGLDADIENDPVFHLFFPDPKDDTMFRKMQHWYFVPVASVLYLSWRIQSLQASFKSMEWKELVPMALNYIWLYFLGWKISLAAIYLGGFLVSFIVTATHQSEEMIDPTTDEGREYSFCEGQFATTRDARTSDPFTEWLWGGMQYQLEHHLFPTMPKYKYRSIAPRVKAFAEANGLAYRCDDTQTEIFKRNFNTLKFFAQEKANVKKSE